MLWLFPNIASAYIIDFSSNTYTSISEGRAEMIQLRDKLEFMIYGCELSGNEDGKERLEEFLEELNEDLEGDDYHE